VGLAEIRRPKLEGDVAWGRDEHGRNPVGVGSARPAFSQGSSFLATLGFGAESLWDSPLESRMGRDRFTLYLYKS